MGHWLALGSMLLPLCGCLPLSDEDELPDPPAIDGVAMEGGAVGANWQGQPVTLLYGVAVPLDDVPLGVVDVFMSDLPINCETTHNADYGYHVSLELLGEPTSYDTWVDFAQRFDGGVAISSGFGVVDLTVHDSETVAGTVTWSQTDMTDLNGDFAVKRCDKPAP